MKDKDKLYGKYRIKTYFVDATIILNRDRTYEQVLIYSDGKEFRTKNKWEYIYKEEPFLWDVFTTITSEIKLNKAYLIDCYNLPDKRDIIYDHYKLPVYKGIISRQPYIADCGDDLELAKE